MAMLNQLEMLLGELRSLWRFRWPAIGLAWMLCILGWCVVLLIPPRYTTQAKVYVDTNSLLRPLLEGVAVPPDTINQVELVRQALLTRPQLERVVDSTDLRGRYKTPLEKEDLVEDLASHILIKGSGPSNRSGASTFYLIAFVDPDPKVSFDVVNELLESFVSQSLGANASSAQNAQDFLQTQISEYEQRLSKSESALAEFKRANIGVMPDDRGGYFERLQAEMVQLDSLQAALNVAQTKREELRGKLLGGASDAGARDPGSAVIESSVDGQIAASRRQLEELLLRFTEAHPDVQAVRDTLNRLEEQRQSELTALRQNRGALGAPRGASSLVAQNLQIALNQAELDLASLRSQISDRQQRVGELRAKINTLPEVEAELSRLTRDYNVTRAQYDTLLQRLESARLSGKADRTDDLRIRVIEPPVVPIMPTSPKLLILLAGVLAAAIGAGAGFAFLRARMHPVYLDAKQLAASTGLRVLGVIDDVNREAIRRTYVRQYATFGMTFAALLFAFLLVVATAPKAQTIGGQIRTMVTGA